MRVNCSVQGSKSSSRHRALGIAVASSPVLGGMSRPLSPAMANRAPKPNRSPATASFSERKAQKEKENATPSSAADDRTPPSAKPSLSKRRSHVGFFEDTFSAAENSAAKERVRGDAIVMAEVKTNVIVGSRESALHAETTDRGQIGDEFTFITELSYHLSTRYQRPISSIVVTLHHGACMFFAGTFDAAYVMSIFALPSQVLPTTNKRNTALIQRHMEGALGVNPKRGFLRFVPVDEEHMATNGKTMAGEIDDLERSYGASPAAEITSSSEPMAAVPSRSAKARRKLSVKVVFADPIPLGNSSMLMPD